MLVGGLVGWKLTFTFWVTLTHRLSTQFFFSPHDLIKQYMPYFFVNQNIASVSLFLFVGFFFFFLLSESSSCRSGPCENLPLISGNHQRGLHMHLTINPFSDCIISIKLFTFLQLLPLSLGPFCVTGPSGAPHFWCDLKALHWELCSQEGPGPLSSLPCQYTPRLMKAGAEVFRLGCWLLLPGLGQCSWIMKPSAPRPYDFKSFLWED